MAERCLCCGKKMGFLSFAHIDNTVCDDCYFKFAGYLEAMKKSNSKEEVAKIYGDVIKIIHDSGFAEEGCKKVIIYVEDIKKEKDMQFLKEENILTERKEREEHQAQIEAQYWQLRKDMLLTTGMGFEGYDIEKYFGVKTGNVVLGTGFLSELSASFSDLNGSESKRMGKKIQEAKDSATNNLIESCIRVGGNAILGISYDMMTIGTNMIVVSANGTVVKIKKSCTEQ